MRMHVGLYLTNNLTWLIWGVSKEKPNKVALH